MEWGYRCKMVTFCFTLTLKSIELIFLESALSALVCDCMHDKHDFWLQSRFVHCRGNAETPISVRLCDFIAMGSDSDEVQEVPLTVGFHRPAFDLHRLLSGRDVSTPEHRPTPSAPASAGAAGDPAASDAAPFNPLTSRPGVLRHALPPRVGASDDSSNEKKAPKRKAKAKSGKSKKQKDEEPDNEFEPLGGHDSDDHDSDPDSQGSGGNDDGLDSSRPAPNPRKRPACNSAKKKPSTKPRKHGDFITSEDKDQPTHPTPFGFEIALQHNSGDVQSGNTMMNILEFPENQLGLEISPWNKAYAYEGLEKHRPEDVTNPIPELSIEDPTSISSLARDLFPEIGENMEFPDVGKFAGDLKAFSEHAEQSLDAAATAHSCGLVSSEAVAMTIGSINNALVAIQNHMDTHSYSFTPKEEEAYQAALAIEAAAAPLGGDLANGPGDDRHEHACNIPENPAGDESEPMVVQEVAAPNSQEQPHEQDQTVVSSDNDSAITPTQPDEDTPDSSPAQPKQHAELTAAPNASGRVASTSAHSAMAKAKPTPKAKTKAKAKAAPKHATAKHKSSSSKPTEAAEDYSNDTILKKKLHSVYSVAWKLTDGTGEEKRNKAMEARKKHSDCVSTLGCRIQDCRACRFAALHVEHPAGCQTYVLRAFDALKASLQAGDKGTATMDHLVELFYAKFATDVARWQESDQRVPLREILEGSASSRRLAAGDFTYVELFDMCLAEFDKRDVPRREFRTFLGELPAVPFSAFRALEAQCQLPGARKMALLTILALIEGKPACRWRGLNLLLKLAFSAGEDVVRFDTIRLIINKIYAAPSAPMRWQLPHLSDAEAHRLLPPEDANGTAWELVDPDFLPIDRLRGRCIEDLATLMLRSAASAKSSFRHAIGIPLRLEQLRADLFKGAICAPKDRVWLYGALCIKRPILLHGLVETFHQCDEEMKEHLINSIEEAVKYIPVTEQELLVLVQKASRQTEALILKVLNILMSSRGNEPLQPGFGEAVLKLYKESHDPRLLVPVFDLLDRNSLLDYLPAVLQLEQDKVADAFRLIVGSRAPPISVTELLMELHHVNSGENIVPIKASMQALNIIFSMREKFDAKVYGIVIQSLVEEPGPLPTLFMRTVIQVVKELPRLSDFIVMEILPRLVRQEVWGDENMWRGFMIVLQHTFASQPSGAARVLAMLPMSQLEDVLVQHPDWKAQLREYVARQAPGTIMPHVKQLLE
ncbi:unnamed protein product [Durusdinium trenchii]|uniref:Symplekin C-terminal domain-containing protein n=1 Tax=Durusdinium trenchii TaxID=1381693 RepID=A0ABP0I6M1_9DINO